MEGTGVTVNAIEPGGAADTRLALPELVPDRTRLVKPDVMGPPIRWLISPASDGLTGHCLTAERWDPGAADDANISASARECGWKSLLNAPTATTRTWPPAPRNEQEHPNVTL